MKNKKFRTLMLILILVLALSIGFALLSTQLKINGTAGISANTWDIHWENVDNELGITPIGPAEIDENDNKQVNFTIEFDKPGEYYEFTVDAVNRGTIDGMITEIVSTVNGEDISNLPPYFSYTIKYADGSDAEINDLLPAGKQVNYKVRLEYLRSITNEQLSQIPSGGVTYEIETTVTYQQSNNSAVDKGNSIDIPEVSNDPCPGCVYAYYQYTGGDKIYYSDDNYDGNERSVLENYVNDYTQLKENYYSGETSDGLYETLDICIAVEGNSEKCELHENMQMPVFLGHKLDSNNKITKAYACGIADNGNVLCIEGTTDGSSYQNNYDLMQSERFFNNTCTNYTYGSGINCGNTTVFKANASANGSAQVVYKNLACSIDSLGYMNCS